MIKGRAYFAGAAPALGARITVHGLDGATLATAVSGADGSFAIPAGPPADHRIVADAGDGHTATFIVYAAEFAGAPAAAAGAAARHPGPVDARSDVEGRGEPSLEAIVEAVVARHVTPLRKQLNAYEDRRRWHDVLGGIGYILGLTGLAAFLLARRRRSPGASP